MVLRRNVSYKIQMPRWLAGGMGGEQRQLQMRWSRLALSLPPPQAQPPAPFELRQRVFCNLI